MDTLENFQQKAFADPELNVLLLEAAQNSDLEESDGQTFTLGLESVVVSWACYALFRWSKMILDARQRNLEMDAARQQVKLIEELVAEDWPREQAEKLVPALLDGIKERGEDPTFKVALEKALALAGAAD